MKPGLEKVVHVPVSWEFLLWILALSESPWVSCSSPWALLNLGYVFMVGIVVDDYFFHEWHVCSPL